MARKSSKTARVMNLLAGGEEEAERSVGAPEGGEGQASEKETLTANQVVEEVKASSTAVTEEEIRDMVHPPQTEPGVDPVAESIRETLEMELNLQEEQQKPKKPEIEELIQPAQAQADYTYLNVMEKIVEDQVGYFMKQLDVCTCDRCVADVKALSLTNLPPKYIVTARATVAPLLNFYTNKFIGQVTVELTKACRTVKEFPHHDR